LLYVGEALKVFSFVFHAVQDDDDNCFLWKNGAPDVFASMARPGKLSATIGCGFPILPSLHTKHMATSKQL
jgi:hypothetical protein